MHAQIMAKLHSKRYKQLCPTENAGSTVGCMFHHWSHSTSQQGIPGQRISKEDNVPVSKALARFGTRKPAQSAVLWLPAQMMFTSVPASHTLHSSNEQTQALQLHSSTLDGNTNAALQPAVTVSDMMPGSKPQVCALTGCPRFSRRKLCFSMQEPTTQTDHRVRTVGVADFGRAAHQLPRSSMLLLPGTWPQSRFA